MRLSWTQAQAAASRLLQEWGYDAEDAAYIARHLLTCDALGLSGLGLTRLQLIRDILDSGASVGDHTAVLHTTPTTRSFTGGGGIGYLTTRACFTWAMHHLRNGTPLVAFTANQFFLNGALRIYARQAAEHGYVCLMVSSSAPAAVAPFAGTQPVLGTNPICIGVPAAGDPVVVDLSTSASTWSDINRAAAKQQPLPEGIAIDRSGMPTRNAEEALRGALLPWGGERGYALSVAVQCLGILAGASPSPRSMADCGLFGVVLDPAVFGRESPLASVDDLRRAISASASSDEGCRLPGQGWSQRLELAQQQPRAVDEEAAALLLPFLH